MRARCLHFRGNGEKRDDPVEGAIDRPPVYGVLSGYSDIFVVCSRSGSPGQADLALSSTKYG